MGEPACLEFQSARPRGARHAISLYHSRTDDVSIRAPARGATTAAGAAANLASFQSARPRGARRRVPNQCGKGREVSTGARGAAAYPHRPGCRASVYPRAREGRDFRLLTRSIELTRFNPRAREGRDKLAPPHQLPQNVSIRAPARGATTSGRSTTSTTKFQSARPRGARRRGVGDAGGRFFVSIRAPARGATDGGPECADSGGFNPRREGDRRPVTMVSSSASFNPRARGATGACIAHLHHVQSAPAKACQRHGHGGKAAVFQSARPRATKGSAAWRQTRRFNPRAREGQLSRQRRDQRKTEFQSARPRARPRRLELTP